MTMTSPELSQNPKDTAGAGRTISRATASAHLREALLPSLIALLVAAIVGDILIVVFGQSPGAVYRLLIEGTWGNSYGFGQVLYKATTLTFTGLAIAFALHLCGWFTQVFETWLILRLISPGVSASAALAIESLALAARSAVFVVPGGVGVQEGALMLLAAPFGIGAPVALSLGLIKRMREVVVGAPAILAWSIAERQLLDRLWRRLTRRPGGEG